MDEPAPPRDAPPVDSVGARVVLITAPDAEVAGRLAEGLVQERLAACVNVLGGVTSVYRWKGDVERASECLLMVKTHRRRLRELEAWLERNHPYDCPECIALEPREVMAGYLAWWLQETRP